MSTEEYMHQAIESANILRTALGRKLIGSLTVAPHVVPGGPIITVYLSGKQAEHLASIIQKYSPTTLAELLKWMEDFEIHLKQSYEPDCVLQHTTSTGPPHFGRVCDWEEEVTGNKLNKTVELAHRHLEEHEK